MDAIFVGLVIQQINNRQVRAQELDQVLRGKFQDFIQRRRGRHQVGDAPQGLSALPPLACILHDQCIFNDGGSLSRHRVCQVQFLVCKSSRTAAMIR